MTPPTPSRAREDRPPARIGLVGTGFIARYFALQLEREHDLVLSRALTRRPVEQVADFPRPSLLTTSIEALVEAADVVVECSGDPLYATEVVQAAVEAGKPVVTMNTEFHVTSGSYFVGKGLVTEAEGDQPGCQAALHEEAVAMGFRPLVYGNMKGFLNEDPTPEEMAFWGARQGISMPMVTSFTDGTKVQAEQALVGNHFGATIARQGMLGTSDDDLARGGFRLAEEAHRLGRPITEYLLSPKLSHGVFLVAEHDPAQVEALRYIKMGDGPYYLLVRPNILVHLEIMKTVRRVLDGGGVLLDNSAAPEISVGTIAKRDLAPGERIEHGIGSFDVRGECVRVEDAAGHAPIGLVRDAVFRRPVERGQLVTFEDIEVPESLALHAWQETEARVLAGSVATEGAAAD